MNDYLREVFFNKDWCYINASNEIINFKSNNFGLISIIYLKNLKTKAEAEKDQLHNELRLLQKHPDIDGVEVKKGEKEYFFGYDPDENKLITLVSFKITGNNVCFSSEEAQQRALEVFGKDRWIKYLTLK